MHIARNGIMLLVYAIILSSVIFAEDFIYFFEKNNLKVFG